MPVVITQNTAYRRACTLEAGSAPRVPGQGVQLKTPPNAGMGGTYLVKSPSGAGKSTGVLFTPPSGFSSLTEANGQGSYYDSQGGGEQRLLAGPGGVVKDDVVIDDADGNWVKQVAGEPGKYVALEPAAAGASFGARPAHHLEKN